MPAPAITSANLPIQLAPQLAQRLALVPETLIEAEVVDVKGDRATLRINQQLLTAQTTLPLQSGQRHLFKVHFTNGQWQLKLQPEGSANPARAPSAPPPMPPHQAIAQLNALLGSSDVASPLHTLISQLNRLLIREADQLSGPNLKTRLKNSGVLMESRLARGDTPTQDAKATLLRLLSQIPDKDTPEARALQSLIRHIEQHQLNALQSDWIGFPLLFTPDSPLLHAQVWIRQPKPDWSERNSWHIIIQLDLKHHGLAEVEIRWQAEPDAYFITFWAPDQRLAQRIQQALNTLESALAPAPLSIRFSDQPLANRLQPPIQLSDRI